MLHTNDSALMPLSAFDAQRDAPAATHPGLQRKTQLSSTFYAELRLLERRHESSDALEVIAACMRLREPALVYMQCEDRVWPLTVFPDQQIYHSPRSLTLGSRRELASLKVMDIEPAAVRPPGHWMHERVGADNDYHSLPEALWRLALDGPRAELLNEVAGAAAYRALRNPSAKEVSAPGALGASMRRLHQESMPLRKVAALPGMSADRATRLINALYLTSNLIVSRAHHAADGGMLRWLFSRAH
jgi:hypothetical protein